VLTTLPGSRMSGVIDIKKIAKLVVQTANKGAGLRDGWKVFFNASLTSSRVLLMVGDLAEDSSFV
jgi:hypothetical protein